MPFCAVKREYMDDPVGKNQEADFVTYSPGEVVRVPPGSDFIVAGIVEPIADSDMAEIVECKCGRMFWATSHPHFTHRPAEVEVQALNAQLAAMAEDDEERETVEVRIKAATRLAKKEAKHAPTAKPEPVKA
jgi:hypothetical protein